MKINEPEFSIRTRRNTLDQFIEKKPTVDALIIGGGIVGVGLARELSIRGLKPIVLEKNDFASGTSSKSSKLIHGGLRYLEMFDFKLVFEALSERHWLLKSHSHLVRPLQFNLPFYDKENAPPGQRPQWMLSLGLWLYDTLSLFRSPFFHGKHSKKECLKIFPGIQDKGLRACLYYADAMMLDDEMVLECAYDAFKRGATLLNYCKVLEVKPKNSDGLFEVIFEDRLNSGKKIHILSHEVISCVGPWTEQIGSMIPGGAVKKLKPSKGVHLIFDHARFPIEHCLVMYSPEGRIIFAIPRVDLGTGANKVIVGTTDSPEKKDPNEITASKEDVQYLMDVLNRYFPKQNLTKKDIVMTYAGVRPLIDDGHQAEAKVSREHEIWKNDQGIIFMAGGKYTTFRVISEELADFAFPDSEAPGHHSRDQLSTPEEYSNRIMGHAIWGKYSIEWFKWKLQHHMPCTLEDLIFRRSPMWMDGKKLCVSNHAQLDEIIKMASDYFSWSNEETTKQRKLLTDSLKMNLVEVE